MAETALIANLAAFVLCALASGRRRAGALTIAGRGLIGVGAIALGALVVIRSVQIRFPALTRTYEGLVILALALDLFLLVGYRRVFRENAVAMAGGAFITFVYLAALSSPLVSPALRPPIPVLRSSWLVLHVTFAFVGLALFSVALVLSILAFLVKTAEPLDDARDRAVALGYVFYTTGALVFGAIWAEAAWGRYWGWDPKETWALITTLFYTAYLHLRYVRRISQRTARVLIIIASALAAFTFWGVNLFMAGLHSYA